MEKSLWVQHNKVTKFKLHPVTLLQQPDEVVVKILWEGRDT